MEERLEHIKRKIKGRRLYYSSYNPHSTYMYDVEDAEDDVLWLIAEVERLRGAQDKTAR
jgi:hypothetical protein